MLIAAQLLLPPLAQAQLPGMGDGGEMTATAERQLGDRIGRELYRDNSYFDDPVLQEYVLAIWQRLMAAARVRGELTPELDDRFAWRVVLMRDREINAFALPGGYMGINLGLIAVVGSRDELATVMGHELSHITQRHIARMLDKQSKQTPLMLAAMVLGAIAAAKSNSRSGGDLGQAMIAGTQALAMSSQLSFSRDMEREADRVGFGVMSQAGFAPQGAASMFEKLQYASRLSDNGSYPYLRSHPLNSERIADMQGRFQLTPGADTALPLAMDHAMISARARVLTRPGVDQLRLWVDAAGSGEFDRSAPAQQAGMLYTAALSAAQLRDFDAARTLAARLVTRTNGDAAAARLARLLSAEVELAAGTPARATPGSTPSPRSAPSSSRQASGRWRPGKVRRSWRPSCRAFAIGWPAIRATPVPGACWPRSSTHRTSRCARCGPRPRPTSPSSTTRRRATASRRRRIWHGKCRRARGPAAAGPLRGVDHRHPCA